MHLSSDEVILWQHGFFKLNVTLVTTWALMGVMVVGAKLITRKLSNGHDKDAAPEIETCHARFPHHNPAPRPTAGFAQPADSYGGKRAFRNPVFVPEGEEANESLHEFYVNGMHISRGQSLLEIIVTSIAKQIEEVGLRNPAKYLGFLGTLFLFVAISNLCTIFPGYEPPTGSLSTTAALAICVFVAVPLFGIAESGLANYLRSYLKPTVLMLPFNIISELSRTLALAIRLFGNIMSGTMIIAILLTITPFIFPIVMSMLGLLTGLVQAYIFTILATVYIAAATRVKEAA